MWKAAVHPPPLGLVIVGLAGLASPASSQGFFSTDIFKSQSQTLCHFTSTDLSYSANSPDFEPSYIYHGASLKSSGSQKRPWTLGCMGARARGTLELHDCTVSRLPLETSESGPGDVRNVPDLFSLCS